MAEYTFKCPGCQTELGAEDSWAGMNLDCPTCGKKITVPPPPRAPLQTAIPKRSLPAAALPPPTASAPLPTTGATGAAPVLPPDQERLRESEFLWLMPGEEVKARYYARVKKPRLEPAVVILLLCIPILGWLVLFFALLAYFFGAKVHGTVLLTNRRVLYVEFGAGRLEKHWATTSFDLASIAGVECFAQDAETKFLGFTTFRKKAFLLKLQSRYPVAFAIGGILRLGVTPTDLCEPAKDSILLTREIGSRIWELQKQQAGG